MSSPTTLTAILEILPDDLIAGIQQTGQNIKLQKWRLGDDVLKVYAHFVVNQIPQNLLDAAWVVHVLTGNEKSQNTLRGYALISQFYPEGVRAELHCEDLPYSHFVYAASVVGNDHKGIPMWRNILAASYAAYLDNSARPISEEKLRLIFSERQPADNGGEFYGKTVQPPDSSRTPVLGRYQPYSGQRDAVIDRLSELVSEIKALLPALSDKPGLARVLGGLVLSADQYFDAGENGLLIDGTIFDQSLDANNGL